MNSHFWNKVNKEKSEPAQPLPTLLVSINTIHTHREDSGNPAPALEAVARGRGAVRDSKQRS